MKTNKFNLATFAIIFFFSLNAISQNTKIYQITPAINKKISKQFPSLFQIYHVKKQKIKYHEYEMGEVISKEYKTQLDILDYEKKDYERYQKDQLNKVQKFKNDYKTCIDLIDKYLNSDENYEVKKEYLIQSKELLRTIPNIKVNYRNDSGGYGIQDAFIGYWDNFKSKPNKKGLIEVKESLVNFLKGVPDFEKPSSVIDYITRLENLPKIKKTAPGLVESQIESERDVALVDANIVHVDSLSGTFLSLPNEVSISNKNIGAPNINKSFLKNEIVESKNVEQFNKGYDDINAFRNAYMIEEVNTKEQYVIPLQNWAYFGHVTDCQKDIELLNILHELGFQEYKGSDDKTYIKTKTAEIELKENSQHLYYMLKENKSSLSSFDNDHIKLISLMKQCITYTSSLTNFNNIYDIKRGFTPVATINAWRTKAISANKLVGQIMDIRGKYAYIYSFSEVENSSPFQTFLDNSVKSNRALNLNY